jgi:predicted RNA-binding protein with TRAM domain
MEISDQLRCLFSSTIDERDGSYRIEIPENEIQLNNLQEGATYRVAILPTSETSDSSTSKPTPEPVRDTHEQPEPPVEEGDQRTVEIETIGDQGDGITRVERGFVVIVPDTIKGERVTIEITDVGDTVAFAEVTERLDSR